MVDFVSPLDNPPIVYSASSSGVAVDSSADDDLDDACSICLEPFNSEDPPTVTKKQRMPYMLAASCIEGPCQLLAAVENERNLRSRSNAHHIHEDNEFDPDNSYADDSDFDDHILQHFAAAAAARRGRYVNRRGRQRSSGIGPSQLLFSVPTGDLPDVQHMNTSVEELQSFIHEFSKGDSPNSSMLATINDQRPSSVVRDDTTMESNSADDRDGLIKFRQLSPESPQRSSEFLAFSESIKSKFSAASSRYKESISKNTRGFKGKLLARNISVKELGKGVQREMNAGISGVARMIERLDISSKRTGMFVPFSSSSGGTSNLHCKGKSMQESAATQPPNVNAGETANDIGSTASPYIPCSISGRLDVPLAQV
ncbi:RING-type E3 ubiquitin transferase [Sarracenia purpurea var. burkii]